MTQRLYYDDCYLAEFDAEVVSTGDERRRVVLDRTAFYPASGGQPFDLGTLGDAHVIEVIDDETGIVHVLDRPLPSGQVHGRVQWDRRWDHMQQHTGQHLLSAVFEDLYHLKTISFHLGSESSTIDLEAPAITPEQLRAVELRANQIVTENRPVRVSYEHSSEASGLRKASEREGELRIVSIAHLDRSACGGTHVRATGEIGAILLRKTEKIRNSVRVEFICGNRAVQQARKDFEVLTAASQALSTAPDEVASQVKVLLDRAADAEKSRRKLSMELAKVRGAELYNATTPDADGVRRYHKRIADAPIDEDSRTEAQSFANGSKAIYLLISEAPPSMLIAASTDSGVNAGALLKQYVTARGGRGGGSATSAQGSVPSKEALADLPAILGFTK